MFHLLSENYILYLYQKTCQYAQNRNVSIMPRDSQLSKTCVSHYRGNGALDSGATQTKGPTI